MLVTKNESLRNVLPPCMPSSYCDGDVEQQSLGSIPVAPRALKELAWNYSASVCSHPDVVHSALMLLFLGFSCWSRAAELLLALGCRAELCTHAEWPLHLVRIAWQSLVRRWMAKTVSDEQDSINPVLASLQTSPQLVGITLAKGA